jgi:FemAB-related protein (PEP-CTERM system-associated)
VLIERFQGEPSEWDGFVRRSAGWTHCHLYGWRAVMERVFGHECIYLAARGEAGGILGALPLVRVKSRLFGHYLVSMPFLNYGGPLGSDAAAHALAAVAAEQARRENAGLLELRSRVALPVALPVSHRKITVVLDLPPGEPKGLWHVLPAKVRSQVRRPQKEGVTVRFGLDQIAPFFDVFSRHMRDLGTPTQPCSFFECIAEVFPQDVWFGCAYLGSRPVACGCGFRWDHEFEMTWASALGEYKQLAPNMLLYWAFLERAAQDGLTLFNFGRCTPGSGTHRFKQQWGARDVPLWWYQRATGTRAGTPSPDDRAFAWGPRMWKRLPLRIANLLGPRIVRLIP